jgi:hypothetical protein
VSTLERCPYKEVLLYIDKHYDLVSNQIF